MPLWQTVFYYLLNSTKTRNAFAGFEKEANGFPLINASRMIRTVMILGFFDILNFLLFTFFVRQKFPGFTPFKMLNLIIKKYHSLIGLSVMTTVFSLACAIIIDCGVDFSITGIKSVFA